MNMSLFAEHEVTFGDLDGYPNLWLDHIAYCVADPRDAFESLRAVLGVQWELWEINGDFGGVQVRFPNGMKIEVIHPNSTNDQHFTNRFVARQGRGPHHLTFRVKRLEDYLERAQALGIELIQVSTDYPMWREAFIHPRDAGGILVQIAECPVSKVSSPPEEWESVAAGNMKSFARIEHSVVEPSGAMRIFGDLLGGDIGPIAADGSFDVTWNDDRVIRFMPDSIAGHRALVVRGSLPERGSAIFTEQLGGELRTEE
jgi:catechol 2,3-dioxygenase-like lactoylglutathione lyase family enzyme